MVYLQYFLGLGVIHVIIYFTMEFLIGKEKAEAIDKYIVGVFWILIIIGFIGIRLSRQ